VRIRFGHSPDPDDAFMHWAFTTDLLDTRGLEFEQVVTDIQTLNQWARAARLEATAISLAAYPSVQEDYALLPHGATMGLGYGPVLLGRTPIHIDEVHARRDRGEEILVPGVFTTAFLALRLALGEFPYRELPTEEIPRAIASGDADLGLVTHAGQLAHADLDLRTVFDLGEWWLLETGLPLPLSVNVVRRDLPAKTRRNISAVLGEAIATSLEHRSEALEHALEYGSGIDLAIADRFIGMYVKEQTQDYGNEGRLAIDEFLRRGEALGAFERPVRIDFVT
jgi:1,4-dihydroxy-6-naphthoate synthase